MKLLLNQLLFWHSNETEDTQIDRVLWIDTSGTDVVTIDINHPHAQPIWHKSQHLLAALANGSVSILEIDPYTVLRLPESEIKAVQRQKRDEAWSAIAPIIASGELVFFPSTRSQLIALAVQRTGRSEPTIRKDLRRYWQRGQILNALLPRFDLCGGKGKERLKGGVKRGRPSLLSLANGEPLGINVDADIRDKLKKGSRLFYETGTKRTLKQAYQLTLEKFFHKGYRLEGGVLVPIMPPAEELPSFRQFQYWYNKSRDISREREQCDFVR